MKALVTGTTGFLGRRVVAELLKRGASVRCLIRPSSQEHSLIAMARTLEAGRLEIIRGDLSKPAAVADALVGCDTVYHIAAEMKGATAVLFLGNVVATRVLVDRASKAGVQRFVLVSSIGVYGTASIATGGVLDENCSLDPHAHRRDPYTYSKVAQELAAWEAHESNGFPLVVVRPGVIYGPGRDCLSARVGLRLGKYLLVMGGRQKMPYVHVTNCAQAVVLAGEVPGIEGQAFNIVDDELPTGRLLLKRYRREVVRIHRMTIPRWAIPVLSRLCEWYHQKSKGQLPAVITMYKSEAIWRSLLYSNDRAKRILGWHPEVGLEAGLEETFEALRREFLADAAIENAEMTTPKPDIEAVSVARPARLRKSTENSERKPTSALGLRD